MRRLLASTALALAALTLAGCSVGMSGSTVDTAVPGVAPAPGMTSEADGRATDSGGGMIGGGTPGSVEEALPSSAREIIVTGAMTVVVDDPIEAADEAAEIAARAGGRVDGRQQQTGTDGANARATLTLRIPADRLESALDEIDELGEPRERNISSDDVTVITRDLDARITALQSSVDRLLSLLDRATDVATLIDVETALSQRQSELEGLQAQRRYYSEQVALSTVTVYLIGEQVADPLQPDTFWDGLVAGWDSLVAFLAGALVVAGVMLPWLVLIAIIVVVVWLIVRQSIRSRRAAASASAAPVTAPAAATPAAEPTTVTAAETSSTTAAETPDQP